MEEVPRRTSRAPLASPLYAYFHRSGSKGAFRLPGRRGIASVVQWNLRPVIFGVEKERRRRRAEERLPKTAFLESPFELLLCPLKASGVLRANLKGQRRNGLSKNTFLGDHFSARRILRSFGAPPHPHRAERKQKGAFVKRRLWRMCPFLALFSFISQAKSHS